MTNPKTHARIALGVRAICVLLACAGFVRLALAQQLGTITFPTSGASNSQPLFLEGVKDLHNFQFDEAAVAFQKVEQLDPNFAMAYWGEAMSHNHALWAEVDVPGATKLWKSSRPLLKGGLPKQKLTKRKPILMR